MLGLGVWEVPVNSMFFKGTAKITVKDNGGEYEFIFEVPGFKGKMLHVDVTFEETTCKGVLHGPMGIKIKLNGTKVG